MSRYIDADFAQLIADEELDSSGKGTVCWVLAHTPTADVREISRGRWELIGKNVSKCTVCGCARNIRTQVGWNFCPVCGAKMGLEN